MKRKGLSIFLVILLCICSVFIAYLVADKVAKSNNSAVDSMTETKKDTSESVGDMILLVEDNEKDFHFYLQGKEVVMVHEEKQYFYDNWSENITKETPKLLITDIDDDGEDEVMIQVVETVNNDDSFGYGVYVLNHITTSNNEETYKVNAIIPSIVSDLINDKISIQFTQDPNCDKNGIIAMAHASYGINYDRETGLPENTAYYAVFRCLQNESGDYLTIGSWERGDYNCVIDEEDSAVLVTVPVIVNYKDSDQKQNAGTIKFNVTVDENCENQIAAKSLSFVVNPDYGEYKYNSSEEEWASDIKNSNTTIPNDKTIDFIQFTTAYNVYYNTIDFSSNNSDLNAISSIHANESYIELTAKKGCTFSEDIIKKAQFSLKEERELTSKTANYDIAYTVSVSTNSDGCQVLKITYDKKYLQYQMYSVTINFGVK